MSIIFVSFESESTPIGSPMRNLFWARKVEAVGMAGEGYPEGTMKAEITWSTGEKEFVYLTESEAEKASRYMSLVEIKKDQPQGQPPVGEGNVPPQDGGVPPVEGGEGQPQ